MDMAKFMNMGKIETRCGAAGMLSLMLTRDAEDASFFDPDPNKRPAVSVLVWKVSAPF